MDNLGVVAPPKKSLHPPTAPVPSANVATVLVAPPFLKVKYEASKNKLPSPTS